MARRGSVSEDGSEYSVEIDNANMEAAASNQKLREALVESVDNFCTGLNKLNAVCTEIKSNPGKYSPEAVKEANNLEKGMNILQKHKAKMLDAIRSGNPDAFSDALSGYSLLMGEVSESIRDLANLKKSGLTKGSSELLTTYGHACNTHFASIDLAFDLGNLNIQYTWLDKLSNAQAKFETTMKELILKEDREKRNALLRGESPLTPNEKSLLGQYKAMNALITAASQGITNNDERELAVTKANIHMRKLLEAENPARLEKAAAGLIGAVKSLKGLELKGDTKYDKFLGYGGFSIKTWNSTISGLGTAAEKFLQPLAAGRYASKKAKLASGVALGLAGFVLGVVGAVGLLAVGIGVPILAGVTGALRGLFTVVLPIIGAAILGTAAVLTTMAVAAAVGITAAAVGIVLPVLGTIVAGLRAIGTGVLTVIEAALLPVAVMIGLKPSLQMLQLQMELANMKQDMKAMQDQWGKVVELPKATEAKPLTIMGYLKHVLNIESKIASAKKDVSAIFQAGIDSGKASFGVAKGAASVVRHPIKTLTEDLPKAATELHSKMTNKPKKA